MDELKQRLDAVQVIVLQFAAFWNFRILKQVVFRRI
jgi:hypothetical protein